VKRSCSSTARVRDIKRKTVALRIPVNALAAGITRTGDHEGSVIYPVVVVDGIKCRALLEPGADSSYVSAALVERLNKRPTHDKPKQIEMMLYCTIQNVRSDTVKVASVDRKFEMTTKGNKVDKGVLLTVSNPHYEEMISCCPPGRGIYGRQRQEK